MIPFFIFHVLFATTIATVLSLLAGHLSPWISIVSLAFGTALAIKPAKSFSTSNPDWRFKAFDGGGRGVIEIALAIFVLYVCVRHFLWLMFPMDHQLATLTAFNYGDLPLHINYIRFFASGADFPPVNPIFTKETLLYPIGMDFYAALWESLSIPLRTQLIVTGVVASITTVVLLRSYAGWWAIGAFFMSGGLAGWGVLQGKSIENFFDGVEWKNLFLSVFIPQRGMLFGLPAGLFLLIAFRRHMSGERPLNRTQAWTLGALWGILPLFHLHAFLIVSVLIGAMAIEMGGLKGLKTLFTSLMFKVAILPATLLVLRSTNWLQKAGIAHWEPGWAAPKGQFFDFMFYNFGPWLLLPLAIAIALIVNRPALDREKRRRLAFEFGVHMLLLILFFNLMLAPWAWDNIKVLIWPYLGLVRVAYLLFDDRPQPLIGDKLRPIVAGVLFLSGFMALVHSIQTPAVRGARIYSDIDLARSQGALQAMPESPISPNAVFAAAPTHDHPLAFWGKSRLFGYEGHLWSHGIDQTLISDISAKQARVFAGEVGWLELANELGITHIYWGPQEKQRFGEGDREWMHVLKNVSRVPDHAIYAIKSAPRETGGGESK